MSTGKRNTKKHVHKYRKAVLYGTPTWCCSLPDCNHYMPPAMSEMVEGKNSICWGCGKTFVLDTEAMLEDRPRCYWCRHPELSEDAVMNRLMADKLAGKL